MCFPPFFPLSIFFGLSFVVLVVIRLRYHHDYFYFIGCFWCFRYFPRRHVFTIYPIIYSSLEDLVSQGMKPFFFSSLFRSPHIFSNNSTVVASITRPWVFPTSYSCLLSPFSFLTSFTHISLWLGRTVVRVKAAVAEFLASFFFVCPLLISAPYRSHEAPPRVVCHVPRSDFVVYRR